MPKVDIRKFVTVVEEIFHEGGPPAAKPLRRGAALAVIRNPFAGRYEPDILPMMEALKPLGLEMAQAPARRARRRCRRRSRATARAPSSARPASSSTARSGMCPAAMRMRELLGGAKAIVPSTKKVGGAGHAARRADHPHQRLLRAQPFRRDGGRRPRRAARRRDGVHPRHDHRARACMRASAGSKADARSRGRTALR